MPECSVFTLALSISQQQSNPSQYFWAAVRGDEGLLQCTFFCSFYVIYICFKITSGRKLKLLRWHYLLNNYLVRGCLICLSLLFSAQSEVQV